MSLAAQQARSIPFTQSSENRWSLGGPQDAPMQQQQRPGNYYAGRASSTSLGGQVSPNNSSQNAGLVKAMSQMTMSSQGDNSAAAAAAANGIPGLPSDVAGNPNVKYVQLNWEDILGGKDGMQGMRVMMAPPAQGGDGNQNRQLRISMGNQGGEASNDGSVPLKVLSFQPVENYPGQMSGGQAQSQGQGQGQMHSVSQASGLSQRPATPMPPRQMSNNNIRQQNYSGNSGVYGQSRVGQTFMPRPSPQNGMGKSCGNCPACQFKQPSSRR